MNEWKIGKLQKKYTQKLTRCEFFNSKSDALYFFKIKIWGVIISKIQIMTRCFFFNSKSVR